MLKNFLKTFNKLPISNKSMVYLMWINVVGDLITSTFVNIYIYNLFSINQVIIYNIIQFSFCLVGFSGIGTTMSILKKDIKNMYYLGYFLFISSFIVLFIFSGSLLGIYLFGILFGIGAGTFRCAVHTQELKNIENKNRDFYSSSISVGNNILNILVPISVSLIFFTSQIINISGYGVLFFILPFVYIISLLFIKNIESYTPKKIRRIDLKNFFNFKKYKYGHLYFLFGGMIDSLVVIVIPIISIIYLKNEINISLFQAFLTLISTTIVIHLSHKRQEKNRLKYFFIIGLLVVLNFLFLGIFLGIISFLIFSLINLFLSPVYRVSEHVYDLSTMDNIKHGESDFFPAMIFREVILWFGRAFMLFLMLFIIYSTNFSLESTLKIGLLLIGISYLLRFIGIYFWEKYEKDNV